MTDMEAYFGLTNEDYSLVHNLVAGPDPLLGLALVLVAAALVAMLTLPLVERWLGLGRVR